MSAITWNDTPSLADNAVYRAWGKATHDGFLATGLVQTTDTGQVDWATAVLGAATINTVYGYEIYRFNDALQATFPIFIRVEYGRGSSATLDCPTMWVTVGRATNGAGVLTGNLLLARQIMMGTTSTAYSAGPNPCFASGDGSGFCVVLHPNVVTVTNGMLHTFLFVERSRDAAGNATGEAVAVCCLSNSAKFYNVLGAVGIIGVIQSTQPVAFGFQTGLINGVNAAPGAFANTAGMSKDPSAVNLTALTLGVPGATPWNSKILMNVHPSDAAYTTQVDVMRYGQPHSYRLFPHIYSAGLGAIQIAAVSSYYSLPAMLWDV